MIIGVFGISGVGKTTVCTSLQQRVTNVKRISASDIIRTYGGLVDYKLLNNKNVDINQLALIEGVKAFTRSDQSLNMPTIYLLELHNVLETPEGIQDIRIDVFRELNLNNVVFLYKPASDIVLQRQNDTKRGRILSSCEELEYLQKRALRLFKTTFTSLGISYEVLASDHYESLLRIIEHNDSSM